MQQTWKTHIKPANGAIRLNFKDVWEYRDLVGLFVKRDFTSKYKQTVLGPLWAVIQPLLTTVVFSIIFGSLATLIGALLSYQLRRHKWAVCLPPILSNMLIIPWVLQLAYGVPDAIPYLMFTVGLSECIAIGLLGNLLMSALQPMKQVLFEKCHA